MADVLYWTDSLFTQIKKELAYEEVEVVIDPRCGPGVQELIMQLYVPYDLVEDRGGWDGVMRGIEPRVASDFWPAVKRESEIEDWYRHTLFLVATRIESSKNIRSRIYELCFSVYYKVELNENIKKRRVPLRHMIIFPYSDKLQSSSNIEATRCIMVYKQCLTT